MNRKLLIPILLVIAAIISAAAYSMGWFHRDTSLQGSGTVEARNIRVGSKVGGRIDKILVREGDSVEPGQVLITFDDRELLASLSQTKAAAEKASRDPAGVVHHIPPFAPSPRKSPPSHQLHLRPMPRRGGQTAIAGDQRRVGVAPLTVWPVPADRPG